MHSEKSIKNTRLIQLIRTLSNLEMKRFGRYLQAPLVNSNPDIIRLFELIKKNHPSFSAKNFNEQKIYQKLYGKGDLRKEKLQDLSSKLLRILERFLLEVYLDKHQQEREVLLTAAIGERLYFYNQQKTNKLITTLKAKAPYQRADDYYHLYELSHRAWYHAETDKLTNDDGLLIQSQEYLDKAYLFRKLEFLSALSDRAKFLNTPSKDLLDSLKKQFLQKSELNLENNVYKLLFTLLIRFHEEGSLQAYQDYKDQLFKFFPNLSPEYRKNFLIRLLNIAINLNLRSKGVTLEETFSIYQIGVEEEAFLNNGKMRDIEFANICIYGFKLGYKNWTNEFMEKHQSYLQESERAYLIPFVRAYDSLFSKDFEKVIDLLKDIQPKQQLKYYGRIQALLIRAFFECVLHKTGNYKLILSTYLSNFKIRMERNNKITSLKKEAYLNFVKVVQKLIPLVHAPLSKVPFLEIKQQLAEDSPMFFRSWLSEKVSEIETATSPK